jgi:hypothetical protein
LCRDELRARCFDLAIRHRDTGLRFLDAAGCRAQVRLCRHLGQRNTGGRTGGIGLRVGEFRSRAIDRDLIIAGIQFDEHSARLDVLILLDVDFGDWPTDPRRDLCNVAVNLRIVCRHASGGDPEID